MAHSGPVMVALAADVVAELHSAVAANRSILVLAEADTLLPLPHVQDMDTEDTLTAALREVRPRSTLLVRRVY